MDTRTYFISGRRKAVDATIRRMALACAVTDGLGTQRVKHVGKAGWGKAKARVELTADGAGHSEGWRQASETATVDWNV